MYREKEIIATILEQLPTTKSHLNKFHESDAEIIGLESKMLAFTTDEFSSEDYMRDSDPFVLGWNLAICTISDILASGADPQFFAHTIVCDKKKWDKKYLKRFASGIGEALRHNNSSFIGGDLGMADSWHYTGICFGKVVRSLSRKGAKTGEQIYITGKVGSGNIEAAISLSSDNKILSTALNKYKISFKPRLKEAEVIREYASSCIDTSDGLFVGLNNISEINGVGYHISNLPYSRDGKTIFKLLSKPLSILFFGECGEYELLFTINKSVEEDFLNKINSKGMQVTRIGEVVEKQIRVLSEDDKDIDLRNFSISARDYDNISDYITDLTSFISEQD